MPFSYIPQYAIHNRNVYIYFPNGPSWDMGQVRCEISEIDLLTALSRRSSYLRDEGMSSWCTALHGLQKWKWHPISSSFITTHLLRYWPFVRVIHRSPLDSPQKGHWRGAFMISVICAWTNGWANIWEAGDLRCHGAHYDVTVMKIRYP